MMKLKFFFIFIMLATIIFLISVLRQSKNYIPHFKSVLDNIVPETKQCIKNHKKCNHLFLKLRYPNQSLLVKPPLKMPPLDLMSRFTQNGDMPITIQFYFNEVYSDSNSNEEKIQANVTAVEFYELVRKVEKKETIGWYGESSLDLERIMNKYLNKIKKKSLVVMGTQMPWVEAIAYHLSASKITTLDYTRKQYELSNLEWHHVNDYLDDLLNNKKETEAFDSAISFSSIEHSGLGRYGDPLSPEGDIDAVQQVHCLLKPGGYFFLGLPTSNDNSSFIEFNAHRVYGYKRLNLLFNGWNKVDEVKCGDETHSIFVLEKKSAC